MSSNKLLSASAAVAALVALLGSGGCSIRQSPPQSSQFAINATQLGCIDKAGNQLESYFAGNASADDVNGVWTCAENALDEFTRKVVGADPGSYSAQELGNFLSRYFIREVPLTPDLLAQAGILKQVLVGGASDRVTVAEIAKLKQFFEVIRAQMQTLRPFMPISPQGGSSSGGWTGIGGRRWQDIDTTYLDHFEAALQSAAAALGGALNSTGTPYSFAQLDALAQAFLSALPTNGDYDGTISLLTGIHSHLSLIQAAKNTFLLPGAAQLSSGSDWSKILTTAASWGELGVRAAWLTDPDRMNVSQEHIDQGAGLVSLGKIFDRAQALLLGSAKAHPSQTITFDELDQLVNAVPAGDLPASAQVIEGTFRPIVRRMIGGSDLGSDGRQAEGITPGNLSKLSDIFHNWYEGQRFLETLYAKVEQQEGDQDGADFLRSTILTSPAAATLWGQALQQTDPQWNANTKLAARRLQKLIQATSSYPGLRPLFMGLDDEITFPKYDEGLRYSFHDLATLNWMQSLSRLLVEGYASKDPGEPNGPPVRADADDWQPGTGPGSSANPVSMTGAGLTLQEWKQAYGDFKPLGIALKFFNPTVPDGAYDRFREGDVFTYVSDGNGYLDMNEASTLLAFAVSAKRKSDRIHADIAARCHTVQLDAVFQQPLIDYSCYTSVFYGQVQEYWDKLDELISYYQNLGDPVKLQFQRLLETSARQNGYQPGVAMSIDDTENLVAVLQYVEAIFTRYDVGDQGYLTPDEAANAFQVFKGPLEQMGKTMSPPVNLDDSSANLVFTYMLAKGELPSGTWDVVWWDIVKHLPLLGNFKADRIRILQVFAALAQSSPKAAAPALAPVPAPVSAAPAAPAATGQ